MKHLFFTLFFIVLGTVSYCQKIIPLYRGEIPNSKPFENLEKTTADKDGNVIINNISIPALTIFLPQKNMANGTAVIICPGGGYYVNAIKHEGTDVAKEFVKKGVAAFVLKYRIPDDRWMINTSIAPLQDAEEAMLIIRSHAKQWNIDTGKVGVMGFSAGGHLASTLGTHYTDVVNPGAENINLRPAFMILIYPLTTFDTAINKKGSADKLLGKNADPDLINAFSNETRVTKNTPPTFIVQATDDPLPVKNSIVFYEALLKNKVKVEMHLYQGGGHGYGMNNKTTKDKWMERCFNWMEGNNWLENK